ncbi:MAG: acyltransferase [Prevotella sp.]|nr:acyltransferase [Prevotella sp.]
MRPTDLQSKVIAFLRFPLIVLVIFAHCNLTTLGGEWGTLPFAGRFIDIFSRRVALFAIPFFFFISGYLFFKTGKFSLDIYLGKLGRRLQSLFVPYILWNLLFLLVAIIVGLFTNRVPIIGVEMSKLTFLDTLKAFWDISLSGVSTIAAPINVPFWFLRDLMVVMVCSPVVFFAVKWFILLAGKRPIVRYALFLVVIFAMGYWPKVTGFNADCWLFFGYGAYYGIRKKEFIVAMLPYALPAFILLLVLIVIEQWFPGEFLYRLQHVVAIVFGMSFTTIMVRAGTWYVQDMSLSNASFFVYAFHYLVLGGLIALLGSGLFGPHAWWLELIIYLLAVAIAVGVSLLFYWLLRTKLPFTTYILMGGRR